MSSALDIDHLKGWIGRSERRSDRLTASLANAYAATVLDRTGEFKAGDVVPQGLQWCLAQPAAPMAELGHDGHPKKGGFLPPVPLPRRMWAGGRLTFHDDLRVGDEVERVSTIADLTVKEGRSGTLCFVTVRHAYDTERGTAIEEEQDIVYREPTATARPAVAAASSEQDSPADAVRRIETSPVLLFRYSALTFNGHRIHYDRTYATQEEGYAGLVVHGPLQAAVMMVLAGEMRPGERLRRFSFRGQRPLIDGEPLIAKGAWTGDRTAALWTGADRDRPFMSAEAEW